jgi:putative transposase
VHERFGVDCTLPGLDLLLHRIGWSVQVPGHRPRLIHRTHRSRRGGGREGFTEADHAAVLDAAHSQLGGPIVLVWDNLRTDTSTAMTELIAARPWLTVHRLPPYAHELNPVEPVGAHLKRSSANLTKHTIAELTALVTTRLGRMQYRPALLSFLASTGLDFGSSPQHPPLKIVEQVEQLRTPAQDERNTVAEICQTRGISRATFHRCIRWQSPTGGSCSGSPR